MTTEFPGNSNKSREPEKATPEQKQIEKITKGEAIRRKKPLGKRFAETFIGGDAKSVWTYVALDVIVPATKDMLADAVSQAVERMIFGEVQSTKRSGRRRGGNSSYVSYNRYSGNVRAASNVRRETLSRRARSSHDFDEIILQSRDEAAEVLDRLADLIEKYNAATVADLYDLVGITGNYTDNKWGWTGLAGASVTRIRNGYLLDLPRPEPLD